MKTTHLSPWEQEEYILQERTPQMIRHLAECSQCRGEIERLTLGVGIFRSAALAWSAQYRPRQQRAGRPAFSGRWAWAAVIPLMLLVLAWLTFPRSGRVQVAPVAAMSDDALLDQVDEQVSVAVPSSMESLTHLVSTQNSSTEEGKAIVQNN